MSVLVLIAWAAPALGGLLAALASGRAGAAAVAGPATTALIGAAVLAGVPIGTVDPVGGMLLVLVGGLAATVQSYALRQLRGASGARATTALLGVVASGSAVFVTATALPAMAAAWTATGAAFLGVLAVHRALPGGRDALRRTLLAFVVADVALWSAVVLDASGVALDVAAVLLVVAAAARAAQLPLQGWLVATVAAPTPVCAFLHAGIVNAGGILLLRQTDLFGASSIAMGAAIAIGAVTMVAAAVAMAVRSDVKGILACSTSAQMGFMLVTCGLGVWAATLIHIAGHAMYKAASFLGAGSAIAAHARRRSVPAAPARRHPARDAATAALAPAAGLLVVAATVPAVGEKPVLLVFAWITGAAALWGALPRVQRAGGTVAAGMLAVGAGAAYLGATTALGALLSLPDAVGHPPAWLALLPMAAAAGAIAVWQHGGAVRDRLYVRAMRLGSPRPLPRPVPSSLGVTVPLRHALAGRSTTVAEGGAA